MATAIPKACLARSAIRCRDVETGPTLGVLAVFPSTGATCRCPVRLEFPVLSLNPGLRQRCMVPDVWPTLSRA